MLLKLKEFAFIEECTASLIMDPKTNKITVDCDIWVNQPNLYYVDIEEITGVFFRNVGPYPTLTETLINLAKIIIESNYEVASLMVVDNDEI